MYELLDHYLGLPRDNWPEKLHAFRLERRPGRWPPCGRRRAQPAQAGPSLPLARYAGDYSDPWYGAIRMQGENGVLAVDFPHSPGLSATLEHCAI